MTKLRLPARDPRTVARDIPGISDALFPQIAPGVVRHFNLRAYEIPGCNRVSHDLVTASSMQHAMLFEIAVAAGEQLINGSMSIDLGSAVDLAVSRQRRHFDAKLPQGITATDEEIIVAVANNLSVMLNEVCRANAEPLIRSPHIPGYEWIASGTGDFAIGSTLIEVKCTNKLFSSSDYRQVMMYWLLSYASSIEGKATEWSNALLINPRLNAIVEVSFNETIQVIGAGRSKVEILELFSSMVGDHNNRMVSGSPL